MRMPVLWVLLLCTLFSCPGRKAVKLMQGIPLHAQAVSAQSMPAAVCGLQLPDVTQHPLSQSVQPAYVPEPATHSRNAAWQVALPGIAYLQPAASLFSSYPPLFLRHRRILV